MANEAALLEILDLTKKYKDLVAVDNLSIEIRPGEVFALLGPNGAGKSTTIGLIAGLLQPTSGAIFFNGKPLKAQDRGIIGLCPQDINVWETLTCFEQLALMARLYDVPGGEARKRASSLLESMGLSDKRDKLARTLSGGMKRRLNIILALVHDPEILILDEPQAGLDPQSRILVREYIEGLSSERTVILTTHDMEEADKLADRVAIIDHGKLLCLGSSEDIKKRSGAGDMVEIQLSAASPAAEEEFRRFLERRYPSATIRKGFCSLLAENATEAMSSLLAQAEGLGIACADYRIRKKSLEDVFIGMTGRGLRE